jgi:hypothetical protein
VRPETEEAGPLGPERGELGDGGPIIVLAAPAAPGDRGSPEALAQGPVVEVLERRLGGRQGQLEREAALVGGPVVMRSQRMTAVVSAGGR